MASHDESGEFLIDRPVVGGRHDGDIIPLPHDALPGAIVEVDVDGEPPDSIYELIEDGSLRYFGVANEDTRERILRAYHRSIMRRSLESAEFYWVEAKSGGKIHDPVVLLLSDLDVNRGRYSVELGSLDRPGAVQALREGGYEKAADSLASEPIEGYPMHLVIVGGCMATVHCRIDPRADHLAG